MQGKRSGHPARAQAAAHAFLVRISQEPAILVFSLSVAAICLDYTLAPVLNTLTPAFASGLLLLLLLRRTDPRGVPHPHGSSRIASWRVLLFSLLHAAIVSTVWLSRTVPALGAFHDRIPHLLLSAAKYVVLLPATILLPWKAWRRFVRIYRAEWLAAVIALVTLYPYRLFDAVWPWYSQALGHAAYTLAHPFVAGLQYSSLSSPLLVGPQLNVAILFWCSGLQGVKLFQIFFILMLVVDWNVLGRRRALLGYFAGLAFMLFANVARITLLVVAGDSFPQFVARHHVTGGWIFFALALALYIGLAYGWLTTDSKTKASVCAATLIQTGVGPASR